MNDRGQQVSLAELEAAVREFGRTHEWGPAGLSDPSGMGNNMGFAMRQTQALETLKRLADRLGVEAVTPETWND